MLLHLEHPAPLLICAYASYRLTENEVEPEEQEETPVQELTEGHEPGEEL